MMKNQPPVGQVPGKKQEVAAMFDAIAPRYDLLNRLLSFGIDRRWRRDAVRLLSQESPERILDVATGTGDLAIEAARLQPRKIIGVDISEEMLSIGRKKVEEMGLSDRITLQKGDSERLPFSDRQFDAAVVGFGVRNFEHLQKGLQEIHRVLRPDGMLVVLEFSRPRVFPMKQLYHFYSHQVLPRVGSAVSRNEGAYRYLPASVEAFPDGEAFLSELRAAGFHDVGLQRKTFGIVTLYRARSSG